MKNDMENNIDTEFTDIEKLNKHKKYVIVGILYIIVIILSIFLVIGIKNQKDTVKNNIEKETTTKKEETIKENNVEKETEVNIEQENKSIIEDANSTVEETNNQIEENNELYKNILNEVE